MTEIWAQASLGLALIAAVIGSAVVPTLIASAFFLPRHLLAHDGSAAASRAFELALDLAVKYGAVLRVLAVARSPAGRIVVDAEKWAAKLIVMGYRDRGPMGHWLIGSVAKQVMHHAPCAVLVAR